MVVTFKTEININVSKQDAWQALSSLKDYKPWNSRTWFDVNPVVGQSQWMHVKLFFFWMSVPVKVLKCDINDELRWQGGIPGVITGSHFFQIERLSDQQCKLVQCETFSGLLAPLMTPLLKPALMRLYLGMNNEIKQYCEYNLPAKMLLPEAT